MLVKMQQRRGTALDWAAEADTVILSSGEFGLETDTGKFKIGDGETVWLDLPYILNKSFTDAVYAQLSGSQIITGQTTLKPESASQVPAVVDGRSGQTANLQSWQVNGIEVASMSPEGLLSVDDVEVNNSITILGVVANDTDAVTKAYVDANTVGIDIKESVIAATTENITLSGTQTIDGISLSVGSRVLVKDQTDASENGIYVVASSTWSRSADADTSEEINRGMYTFVESGTQNGETGWTLTTLPPYTLDTTELHFSLFSSGVRAISAGTGMTSSGNVFNVIGTADRIIANADSIDIASTYAGQTSITTLGTIDAGKWHGSTVEVAYGGTGASDPETARINLSAAAASHTHTASNITDQTNLDVGKINGKKISVQSSAPTSPSDGDLWFY